MAAKALSHVNGSTSKNGNSKKSKASLSHNNRDFMPGNVDPERMKDNITFKKQSITEAYQECFGEALKEYNKKQAREDRKIDDYYAHLFGNQQKNIVAMGANREKSFYETLVQIGDMHDTGVGSADGQLAAKCLEEYARSFSERNPQFHVFNSVLHMDEKTPHLHINYVPVATGYKKGLVTRNSLSQALKQMGHGDDKESINRWRLAERKVMEDICRKHEIEIKPAEPGRGKSYSTDVYRQQAQKGYADGIEQAQEEFNKNSDAFSDIMQEVQELRQETEKILSEIKQEVQKLRQEKAKIQE